MTDAAQTIASPQRTQAYSNLGLGTVVTYNVGTGPSNIVQLDGSSKIAKCLLEVSGANEHGPPVVVDIGVVGA